jgi:hypothetical protein
MGLETPLAVFAVAYLIYRSSQFEGTWRKNGVTQKEVAGLGLIGCTRHVQPTRPHLPGCVVRFLGDPTRQANPSFTAAGCGCHFCFHDQRRHFAHRFQRLQLHLRFLCHRSGSAWISRKTHPVIFSRCISTSTHTPYGRHFDRSHLPLQAAQSSSFVIYFLLVQIGFGKVFPRTAFLLDFGISLILIFAVRLAAYWFGSQTPATAETPVSEFKSNWKQWLTEGAIYYGIVGGLLAAYMLFNKIMFGTSSPVSGQVKRWWGSIPDIIYERPPTDWFSFFGIGAKQYSTLPYSLSETIWILSDKLRPILPGSDKVIDRYFLTMFIITLAVLVLIFINRRTSLQAATKLGLLPLAAGSLIHILSYTATAYGGAKEWYWVSENLLLIFVGVSCFKFASTATAKDKIRPHCSRNRRS